MTVDRMRRRPPAVPADATERTAHRVTEQTQSLLIFRVDVDSDWLVAGERRREAAAHPLNPGPAAR